MLLNEAMMTTTQIDNKDLIKEPVKASKLDKMIKLIKKKDALELTKVIDSIPRVEIAKWIDRLTRYRYKKYPFTAVAISKLKWRRGY
jgi:hypothetical protein